MNRELPALASREAAFQAVRISKRRLSDSQIESIVRLVKAREWLDVNASARDVNDPNQANSDIDANDHESHLRRLFQELGLGNGSFKATVQRGEITFFEGSGIPNNTNACDQIKEFVLLAFAHRRLAFGFLSAQVTQSKVRVRIVAEGRHAPLQLDRSHVDA